jgi:heptaprenyl diphosphate synthase
MRSPIEFGRTGVVALLVALAFATGMLENLLPALPLPGVRIGLANIFVVTALCLFGARAALLVVVSRVLLTLLFTGNLFAFLCSFFGGLLAVFSMEILRSLSVFSVAGISTIGAVAFNIGQFSVVVFLMGDVRPLIAYLPVLLVAGVVTGLAVGFLAARLLSRLKEAGYSS